MKKRTLFVSRHRLTECPSCHAHVRVGPNALVESCSFCGTRLSAASRDVFSRLLDMGGTTGGVVTALLGLGLVRCSDAPIVDLVKDSGEQMVVPLYGIPPVDSGLADAAIVDAREPLPQPEYGAPPVDAGTPLIDAGHTDTGMIADAAEPLPEPDYGIPPIHDDAAVGLDADDAPPVALYGIPPVVDGGEGRVDASNGSRDGGGRRDGSGAIPDAEDPPPGPLYGIAPIDAGSRLEDAGEEVPVPLYGGAAVQQPTDEILS